MFCPVCGKQIRDDSKFCSGCGTNLSALQGTEDAPQREKDRYNEDRYDQRTRQEEYYSRPEPPREPEPKKKSKLPLLIGIVAALAAVLVVLAVFVVVPRFKAGHRDVKVINQISRAVTQAEGGSTENKTTTYRYGKDGDFLYAIDDQYNYYERYTKENGLEETCEDDDYVEYRVQYQDGKIVSERYRYKNEDRTEETQYDENGWISRKTSARTYTYDGGDKGEERVVFDYEDGRMTRVTLREELSGEELSYTVRYTQQGDTYIGRIDPSTVVQTGSGEVISESVVEGANEELAEAVLEYRYRDGRLTYEDVKAADYYDVSRHMEYSYYEDGTFSRTVMKTDYVTVTRSYDEDGHLTTAEVVYPDGGKTVSTYTYIPFEEAWDQAEEGVTLPSADAAAQGDQTDGTLRPASEEAAAAAEEAGPAAAKEAAEAAESSSSSPAAPADSSAPAAAAYTPPKGYDNIEAEAVKHSNGTLQFVSSDVTEYPKVKLYYSCSDSSGEPLLMTSPTAGIRESISGGQEIERTVRRVERLEGNQGISIDILADKSASMEYDLAQMQTVMTQFVQNMDFASGDRAEIISFDSYIMYMCTYTADAALLQNGIANMTAYGETTLYDALYTGVMNAGSQAGARCVIAFTDGQDTMSTHTMDEVIALAKLKEVPVYIIGTGGADQSVLLSICEQTGGNYWPITNISDMTEIMMTIYGRQKDLYCIEYESDASADPYAARSVSCAVTDGTYGCEAVSVPFQATQTIQQTHHDKRYEVIAADVSWTEANDACIVKGGHLATITSQAEMDEISRLLEADGRKYYWIGGYTSVRNSSAFGHWITGEDFGYTAWYPGEPSRNDKDGTPEFYLMMWHVDDSWTWNDQRNDVVNSEFAYFKGQVGYVCEYEQ